MAKRNGAIQIGTAASRNAGLGVNQIPDMSAYSKGAGWFYLPSGQLLQYGTVEMTAPKVSINGGSSFTQTFNFPIAFPNEGFVTLTKWDTTNWTAETIVQNVVTKTGFDAIIFHGMDVQPPYSNKLSFFAIGT